MEMKNVIDEFFSRLDPVEERIKESMGLKMH